MANTATTQILEDGDRNVIAKVNVQCTSADLTGTVILDPAALNPTRPPSDLLAIDEVQFSIQDGWSITLDWDATTAKRIINLDGRGKFPLEKLEPITNDAGAGRTGKILLNTLGYSSGTMIATIILYCLKERDPQDDGPQSNVPILTEDGTVITTETGRPLLTE